MTSQESGAWFQIGLGRLAHLGGAALKPLPEAFAQDHDRLARFEREAKLLASLNQPGIALYGFESVVTPEGEDRSISSGTR